MAGETVITKTSGAPGLGKTPPTVTALPPAVTVKAEAGGRFDSCRFSENPSRINSPASLTPALVSVGGVVSAATVMSKVSLTDPPLPSLAVTFTATVPVSAACGVPEKVRVLAAKDSHVGSAVSSAFVAV